jgi:hypothetical protein
MIKILGILDLISAFAYFIYYFAFGYALWGIFAKLMLIFAFYLLIKGAFFLLISMSTGVDFLSAVDVIIAIVMFLSLNTGFISEPFALLLIILLIIKGFFSLFSE